MKCDPEDFVLVCCCFVSRSRPEALSVGREAGGACGQDKECRKDGLLIIPPTWSKNSSMQENLDDHNYLDNYLAH